MAEVGRPTSAQTLHTEFAFVLPRGYVDETGTIHREGVMRLATARDEILPQRDPREVPKVPESNGAYLTLFSACSADGLFKEPSRLGVVAACLC